MRRLAFALVALLVLALPGSASASIDFSNVTGSGFVATVGGKACGTTYTVTVAGGGTTETGTVSTAACPPPPPPPPPPPSGYTASYFDNITLSGTPALVR